MRTVAVIGKNFGDEGKGLAVDYFASHAKRPLVVRHNGGAQSGHTVECQSAGGKRFVFHELSSGSLRGAQTLWINSFYPDLYQLGREIEEFRAAFGYVPAVFAGEDTCITVPDDVLINMALETSRGKNRHGSCGMGINECDLRTRAGCGVPLGVLSRLDAGEICRILFQLRRTYFAERLSALTEELTAKASAYTELLSDDHVLRNAAQRIADNMKYVSVLSDEALRGKLSDTDLLIFEAGQGLLLDCENDAYAPHVTASSTGLKNPCVFLSRMGLELDEAVYVSRTYVTRHGAGMLHCECCKEVLGAAEVDLTNEPNEWQGEIRYAAHESEAEFTRFLSEDIGKYAAKGQKTSLFLTHLNETDNCVVMKDGRIPAADFITLPGVKKVFSTVYLSSSRYSEDVTPIDIGY